MTTPHENAGPGPRRWRTKGTQQPAGRRTEDPAGGIQPCGGHVVALDPCCACGADRVRTCYRSGTVGGRAWWSLVPSVGGPVTQPLLKTATNRPQIRSTIPKISSV